VTVSSGSTRGSAQTGLPIANSPTIFSYSTWVEPTQLTA
jgi:hypothetical protein